MAEGQIRLRYSGAIFFLSRVISVGTGLLFTLMVTRNVSLEDYGVFNNLWDVLSYFTLTSTIIPFWVTRFVARNWPGSFKTGFVINALIGSASTMLYVFLVSSVMQALRVGLKYMPIYLTAAITIFLNHVLAILEAALYSKRPEKLGFGLLVFEVSRVVLGFILIIALKAGLMGALMAIVIASSGQSLFYLGYLLQGFKEKIVWIYAWEWFKGSLLNVYGLVGGRLLALASILLFVYGGDLSRAYYGAAYAIASTITYSSALSFALYPKILSGAGSADIDLSLKMVLMLAIPMFAGTIILSRDLLVILSPLYEVAELILMVLSLNAFFLSVSSIFESIIIGMEKLDVEARISYKEALRSKLFLMLTLQYVHAAIVILPTYIVLSSLPQSPLSATLHLAVISTIGSVMITVAKYFMAKNCIDFNIPWSSAGKYFLGSLAMVLGLLAFQWPPRLLLVLAKVFVGMLIYAVFLLSVDREVRETVKSVVRKKRRASILVSGA